LREGRVIASGLHAVSGRREQISRELWKTLEIVFGHGRVEWNGIVYHSVTVLLAAPFEVESVAGKMRVWLEERRAGLGDELKKTLQIAAREEFDQAFTVRAFNQVYSLCYGRARGRPEKNK
jgi:hypothetical protein